MIDQRHAIASLVTKMDLVVRWNWAKWNRMSGGSELNLGQVSLCAKVILVARWI